MGSLKQGPPARALSLGNTSRFMNVGNLQSSTCEMRSNLEVWKEGSTSFLPAGPLADIRVNGTLSSILWRRNSYLSYKQRLRKLEPTAWKYACLCVCVGGWSGGEGTVDSFARVWTSIAQVSKCYRLCTGIKKWKYFELVTALCLCITCAKGNTSKRKLENTNVCGALQFSTQAVWPLTGLEAASCTYYRHA